MRSIEGLFLVVLLFSVPVPVMERACADKGSHTACRGCRGDFRRAEGKSRTVTHCFILYDAYVCVCVCVGSGYAN